MKDGARPDLGSLCGGGRYDALPEIFGRPELAATGAAGGVERIAMSLDCRSRSCERTSVYVAYTEPALIKEALEALAVDQGAGIRSETSACGRRASEAARGRELDGLQWVLIVGRKELDSGNVLLKDLGDGSEKLLPRGDSWSASALS